MKPTLIIAEDLAEIREHIHVMLQEDFEIVAAVTDGKAAVDACRRHEPDLLLMDIVMPGFSGIDAAKQLLGGPPPHPKILLVSEVKNDGVVRRALETGVAGVMLKPLIAERLKNQLLSILVMSAEG